MSEKTETGARATGARVGVAGQCRTTKRQVAYQLSGARPPALGEGLEEDGLTAGDNELQSRTVDAGKQRWGIREDRFRMKVGESDGALFLAAVDEAAKEGDIAHAGDLALVAAEDGAAALCTWLDRKRELDEVTGEKLPLGAGI